jgi:hypothetical protein
MCVCVCWGQRMWRSGVVNCAPQQHTACRTRAAQTHTHPVTATHLHFLDGVDLVALQRVEQRALHALAVVGRLALRIDEAQHLLLVGRALLDVLLAWEWRAAGGVQGTACTPCSVSQPAAG